MYAEHYDKRIQMGGYLWTKSGFFGLSIGVHLIGNVVLNLLDHGEEYTLKFPSWYGRSILGQPWIELGGPGRIECLKTGYHADIQFLTKPFYGGKKHQIQGSIYGPDKKVLNTIDGEWNDLIYMKTGDKSEILLDTNSMKISKKHLRKFSKQSDNESRKLWKEVTVNLRNKNVELAAAAEQRLLQQESDEIKRNMEENKEREPKHFYKQGEHWVYVRPLTKRLQQKESDHWALIFQPRPILFIPVQTLNVFFLVKFCKFYKIIWKYYLNKFNFSTMKIDYIII